MGALQLKMPVRLVPPVLLIEVPTILTYPFGSPPVHVTVKPCVRSRLPATGSMFENTNGESGSVTLDVK